MSGPILFKATVRGVKDVTVMPLPFGNETYYGSFEPVGSGCYGTHGGAYVTDLRPLLVLDPERCESKLLRKPPRELTPYARDLVNGGGGLCAHAHSAAAELVEDIARALTEQVPPVPPRIEEPAVYQRVTASTGGAPRRTFVRFTDHGELLSAWVDSRGVRYRWNELIDPVLDDVGDPS